MKQLFACLAITCLLLCSCDLFTVQSPVFYNLDFEKEIEGTDIPYSWEYNNAAGYSMKWLDNPEDGGKCLRIFCEKPNLKWFEDTDSLAAGAFFLRLSGDLVRGKKLEVRAKVKTKAVTQNARLGLTVMGDSLCRDVSEPASGLRATKPWTRLSVETTVEQEATEVYIAGVMSGRGTAWFDDFEIRIDGKRLKDSDPPAVPTKEEIEWLRSYIYPIRSVDSGTSNDDLLPLVEKLKNVPFVALGGASFGSSENFRLRNRIIQYLAEKEGFGLLTMETFMPWFSRMNDSTLARYYWPYQLWVRQADVWNRQEYQALSNWTTKYNEDKARLYWSSFQNYPVSASFEALYNAFKPYPDVLAELTAFLSTFSWREPDVEKVRSFLHTLASHIRQQITDEEQKEWLLENTVFLEQQLTNNYQMDGMYKDYNVDNVLWHFRHNPDRRMIIWSANPMIKKNGYTVGSLLSEKLADDFISVGFAFYEGNYYAYSGAGFGSGKQKALKAYPGTYEYYFHQLDEPIFMIDLREIRKDLSPDGQWLREPAFFREVGTIKTTTEFSRTLLSSDYDILIFIDQSNATKGNV